MFQRPALEIRNGLELQAEHLAFGWFLLRAGLHRHDHGRLPRRAPSALAAMSLSTHVGVVHFHAIRKDPPPFTLQHHLHEFLFHLPDGLVQQPDLPLGFQRGDAVIAPGEHSTAINYLLSRRWVRCEDGAHREAGLPMVGIALVKPPVRQQAMITTTAVGTFNAVGPPHLEEGLSALVLRAKSLEERHQGYAVVELQRAVDHETSWDEKTDPCMHPAYLQWMSIGLTHIFAIICIDADLETEVEVS